jgi:hypothetical protein
LLNKRRVEISILGIMERMKTNFFKIYFWQVEGERKRGSKKGIRKREGLNMIKLYIIPMYGNNVMKPFCTINMC